MSCIPQRLPEDFLLDDDLVGLRFLPKALRAARADSRGAGEISGVVSVVELVVVELLVFPRGVGAGAGAGEEVSKTALEGVEVRDE